MTTMHNFDPDAFHGQNDAGNGLTYTVIYADDTHTTPIAIAEYHRCRERRIHAAAMHSTDLDPDALARYADEHDTDAPAIIPFDVPETTGWHRRPDGSPGPKWTLENTDPLTLSPSIACGQCGFHGYLRNGQWQPC